MKLSDDAIKRSEKAELAALTQGWAMAASQVMRLFDEPGIAYDLMSTAGIRTRADVRKLKLEKFDTDPLHAVLKQQGVK